MEAKDRGGREIEIVGIDADATLVWVAHSWGASGGKDGYFAMSWDDDGLALNKHDDATFGAI